ncbi:MAG: isoprenylcysteine carboxylmethyltransferase family protein [Candidatus Bathyarchaeota archaeon]|nr:MAG: isoprenylcysteine carboxylmethyltransferase family protein [Candidatus Bathyarchaeota archaeon]
MDKNTSKRLRRAGIKQVLLSCLLLTIEIIIFFISAGHTNVPRAWIFFSATFVYLIVSTAALYKFNPELLVHRLKRKREDSKLWDEILVRANNLTVLIAVPATAGLDVGRFHWSDLGIETAVLGFAPFIVSTILLNWAMIVNLHFEPTVRIQKDRDHKVITSGPYKIVRHPGYLAGVLFTSSIPLILGSILTFIPTGIYILLIITRTLLEDKTLQKELEGYPEYAKKVKHKLIPRIW